MRCRATTTTALVALLVLTAGACGTGPATRTIALAREIPTTTSTSTTTSTTVPPPTTSTTRVRRTTSVPAARPTPRAVYVPVASTGRSGSFYMTCYGPPEFPRGSSTATGYPAGPDEIAVDPHVIPYHSHVHIDGWGDFVAADTGGAIKGHRIDLWRSSCSGFPNPTVTASW